MSEQPPILITRPAGKADRLLAGLDELDIRYLYQPLSTTQLVMLTNQDRQLLQQAESLIFASVSAVSCLKQQIESTALQAPLFSVGSTTAMLLQNWLGREVCSPKDQRSEGVLRLAQLQQVKDKRIVIVRGNGGRELMKQELQARGANVKYVQSYKRVPLALDGQQLCQQWQQQCIRCMVVTSNEILQLIFGLIPQQQHHWLQQCYFIVVSPRLRDNALQLGIAAGQIILADNASDQALLDAISLFRQQYQ